MLSLASIDINRVVLVSGFNEHADIMMEMQMGVEYPISYHTYADSTRVITRLQSVQYLISVSEHRKPVSSFKSDLKTILFTAGFSWMLSPFPCL